MTESAGPASTPAGGFDPDLDRSRTIPSAAVDVISGLPWSLLRMLG